MGFQVSPGVEVKEIDLTNVIPAVSTSIGGFAGNFNWGPVDEVKLVSSEKELSDEYGLPTEDTYSSFLQAASFLKYGNALNISRAKNGSGSKNSVLSLKNTTSSIETINGVSGDSGLADEVDGLYIANEDASVSLDADALVYGKYFGALGNSIKVHFATFSKTGNDGAGSFKEAAIDAFVSANAGTSDWAVANVSATANDEIHVIVEDEGGAISGTKGTILEIFEGLSLYADAKKDGVTNFYETVVNRDSEYIKLNNVGFKSLFTSSSSLAQPGDTGASGSTSGRLFTSNLVTTGLDDTTSADVAITGTGTGSDTVTYGPFFIEDVAGGIKSTNVAIGADISAGFGAVFTITRTATVYTLNVIKHGIGFTITGSSTPTITVDGTLLGGAGTTNDAVITLGGGDSTYVGANPDLEGVLKNGVDDTISEAGVVTALNLLADPNTVDVNLLFAGQINDDTTIPAKLVEIAGTTRKDCVAFISPDTDADSETDVSSDLSSLSKSSYVILSSSAVYVYNKYADKFQFIHSGGHIAGLCARTDSTNDPWFSPAGYNRGQLLGVSKLKYNPNKTDRDKLYKASINPIVAQPGQGILLFGDKTNQAKPSAFDRINVRRLFIVLQKAISTAAKFQLFELNDEFTRAMFRNMVEPFLRDVKGRRGINDFIVICDETNNTGNVIDSNQFVADIFIKPARSINFITLNFIATRTGVEFSEIVGTGN